MDLTELLDCDIAFILSPSPQLEENIKHLNNKLQSLYLHKYEYNLKKLKGNSISSRIDHPECWLGGSNLNEKYIKSLACCLRLNGKCVTLRT